MVQAGPGINQDTISKITNAKRAGRVAQVVEHLPSKLEAFSSTPSTTRMNECIGEHLLEDWQVNFTQMSKTIGNF
jgi:hypothetical protein